MSIYEIPQIAKDNFLNNGDIFFIDESFTEEIHFWDMFDEETGTGFNFTEQFVGRILEDTTSAEFDNQLRPTKILPQTSIPALFEKKTISFNQDEKSVAKYIYSNERISYIVKSEIDLENKFITATLNKPETNEDITQVFKVESFEPYKEQNGSFRYGRLTLKEIRSYEAEKQGLDGAIDYIKFNWFIDPIQPTNAKYKVSIFKSVPLWFFSEIIGGGGGVRPDDFVFELEVSDAVKSNLENSGITIDGNILVGDELTEHLVPWIRIGNSVDFLLPWTSEFKWWDDTSAFTRTSATGQWFWIYSGRAPQFRNTRGTNGNGFSNLQAGIVLELTKGFPNETYQDGRVNFVSLIGGITRTEFLQQFAETMVYTIPNNYSLFGIEPINREASNLGGKTLPRVENTLSVWEQNKEEDLYLNDLVVSYSSSVATNYLSVMNFAKPRKNSVKYTFDNGSIPDYEPYYISEKRKENISDISSRTAVWKGITWNERPDPSFDSSVLLDGADPRDWDTNVLTKTLALIPKYDIETIQEIADGSDFTPVRSASSQISQGIAQETQVQYVNNNNYKGVKLGSHLFFENQGLQIVVIQDMGSEAVISQFTDQQYGGYEVVRFWLDENGDFAVGLDADENLAPVLPATERAVNRKGAPLNNTITKIYGATMSKEVREAKKILVERNKEIQKNGKGKMTNVKTGEEIKR